MEYIMIEDISKHEGQEVELRGWLYNKRSTGKLQFLIIRDGTGFIQSVIFKGNFSEEQFDEIDKLNIESSIIIRGKVKEDKRSPIGFEIDVSDFEIVCKADDDYPIQLKEHGTDFLLNHRHLWLRTPRQHAIMRIRDEIILASRNFFDTRGFTLIDTPILSGNACEGTSTLFELDYFGQQAYLSQSGQLYNEAAALAFGKVYCFGPTFRAEKSKTRRHLTEFWMIEPEAAWYHLDDVMKLSEDYVYHLVQSVLKNRQVELKILERDISKLEKIQLPFPRLEYSEVLEKLNEIGIDFEWGKDLGAEEETKISEMFDSPLLVHRYPSKAKAFYMEPDPEDSNKALCVDMLAPEGYGEIIGGSERVYKIDVLKRRLKEFNLPEEAFQWYIDLRRFGSVPHGGFGLGIERTVTWICGMKHVREAIPFPRTISRLYP